MREELLMYICVGNSARFQESGGPWRVDLESVGRGARPGAIWRDSPRTDSQSQSQSQSQSKTMYTLNGPNRWFRGPNLVVLVRKCIVVFLNTGSLQNMLLLFRGLSVCQDTAPNPEKQLMQNTRAQKPGKSITEKKWTF